MVGRELWAGRRDVVLFGIAGVIAAAVVGMVVVLPFCPQRVLSLLVCLHDESIWLRLS